MIASPIRWTAALCCLVACTPPKSDAPKSGAAPAPSAAAAAAEPAPPPVAVVAAPAPPPGPARKIVTGEGIRITETAEGQVILKTTATWGEVIDTTYSDCNYYTAAIPVLSGQLSAARAKLLTHVCAKTGGKR